MLAEHAVCTHLWSVIEPGVTSQRSLTALIVVVGSAVLQSASVLHVVPAWFGSITLQRHGLSPRPGSSQVSGAVGSSRQIWSYVMPAVWTCDGQPRVADFADTTSSDA